MYQEGEDRFYYITLYNENYAMPPMPADFKPEAVLKGIYKFRAAAKGKAKVQLFGSGPILNEALARATNSCRKIQRGERRVERHQL